MSKNTLNTLKHRCYEMLVTNDIKPTTKVGKLMVYAFWMGSLSARDESSPFVSICLSTGRYTDLIAKELIVEVEGH